MNCHGSDDAPWTICRMIDDYCVHNRSQSRLATGRLIYISIGLPLANCYVITQLLKARSTFLEEKRVERAQRRGLLPNAGVPRDGVQPYKVGWQRCLGGTLMSISMNNEVKVVWSSIFSVQLYSRRYGIGSNIYTLRRRQIQHSHSISMTTTPSLGLSRISTAGEKGLLSSKTSR